MSLSPEERLIVALDFPALDDALSFVETMGDVITYYKVGLELFSAAGPDVVKRLKSAGKSVFLDLKFYDIPNTVAGAAAKAAETGANMFNVHALGGMAMMRAAADSASDSAKRLDIEKPILLGVTVVTSLDSSALENEIGIPLEDGLTAFIVEKAQQSKEAGLDGVVASPNEVEEIRAACGEDFHIVTPGVRPTWAAVGDQKRVATPADTIKMGADRIVVGRPITRAENPLDAARRILDEMT
jgi:orotidine-5'-phosphate decarboxylase